MKGIVAGFACLSLTGPDARDFAHRLTTVHAKNLRAGQGSLGLFLQANGKLVASFFVLCLDQERFYFLGEKPALHALAEEFEKLHFSEKIEFKMLPGDAYFLRPGGVVDLKPREGQHFTFVEQEGRLYWPLPVAGQLVGCWSQAPLALESDEESFWEFARICALWPKLGREWQIGTSNALDVGFADWIHPNKGCYPGQEVIERTQSIGHPAQALILLSCKEEVRPGDIMRGEEGEAGKITSSLSQVALGLVRWKYKVPGKIFKIEREHALIGEASCLK